MSKFEITLNAAYSYDSLESAVKDTYGEDMWNDGDQEYIERILDRQLGVDTYQVVVAQVGFVHQILFCVCPTDEYYSFDWCDETFEAVDEDWLLRLGCTDDLSVFTSGLDAARGVYKA